MFAWLPLAHGQTIVDPVPQDRELSGDDIAERIGQAHLRIGYNSDREYVIGLGYESKRFLGKPQSFKFFGELSRSERRYSFDFQNEDLFGGDPDFGLQIYRNETYAMDNLEFNTLATGVSPSVRWRLSDQETITARYLGAWEVIDGVNDTSSAILLKDEGERWRHALGLGYALRAEDVTPYPSLLRFKTSLEAGLTNDDQSYVKSNSSLSFRTDLAQGNVRVSAELSGGALLMTSGQSSVGDRYFLGQAAVRGFEFGGMGPRDLSVSDTPALGGNHFLIGRFDVQFPKLLDTIPKFIPGFFLDTGSLWSLDTTAGGNAGANPVDDGFHLRTTIGPSLQINSGPGAVRVSYGYVLNKQDYDRVQELQISFRSLF